MRKIVLIALAAGGLSLPLLAGCSYHDGDYDDYHHGYREAYYDDCAPVRRAQVIRHREYDRPHHYGRHDYHRHRRHHR